MVSSLSAQQKRRVAVLSFNLGQDAQQQASKSLNIQSDLGQDLSDQLVAKLVTDGKFTLVERAALAKIIAEQNLSNSDRFDPDDAAKIGKLAGVNDVIIGTVTQLSGSDKATAVGTACRFVSKACSQRDISISVAVTARIIDTNNAAIVASATGAGEATTRVSGYKSPVIDTTGSSFGNQLLADATLKAINSMAAQLEAVPAMGELPRSTYKGVIADVSGSTIIFTVGSKDGAKVGDTVKISRVSRVVPDPNDPTKILKVVSETVGTAKVTETDETTATATFTGSGVPKVKDAVTFTP